MGEMSKEKRGFQQHLEEIMSAIRVPRLGPSLCQQPLRWLDPQQVQGFPRVKQRKSKGLCEITFVRQNYFFVSEEFDFYYYFKAKNGQQPATCHI